jgi:hypothetical protein
MQQLDAKAVEVEKVLGPLKDAGLVKSVRSKAGAGYMHGPATPLVVVMIDDPQPKRHLPEVQALSRLPALRASISTSKPRLF